MLQGPEKAVAVTALVDSGADLCTFRADLAAHIGFDLESGREVPVAGVTGDGRGWVHTARLVVDADIFDAEVLFLHGDTAACLGRYPLFCKRQVTFCQGDPNPALWWFEFSPHDSSA